MNSASGAVAQQPDRAGDSPDPVALREGQSREQAGDIEGAIRFYDLCMKGVSLEPCAAPQESASPGDGVPVWDASEHWHCLLNALAQPYRGEAGWPQPVQVDTRALVCERLAALGATQGDPVRALHWARAGERLSHGHPRLRLIAAELLLAMNEPALAVAEVRGMLGDRIHAWPYPPGTGTPENFHARCVLVLGRASKAMPQGAGLDHLELRAEWLWGLLCDGAVTETLRSAWLGFPADTLPGGEPGPVIMRRLAVQLDAYFPDAPGPVRRVRAAHFEMAGFWSPLRDAVKKHEPALPAWRRLLDFQGAFGQLTSAGMRELVQELKTTSALPEAMRESMESVSAALQGILRQSGAQLLLTTVYGASDQPDNALSRASPVVWPLQLAPCLRTQLDTINALCLKHDLPVEQFDYLSRHGGWHRPPEFMRERVSALSAVDPGIWDRLLRSPGMRLSRISAEDEAPEKPGRPLLLNERHRYERWKLLREILLPDAGGVFESVAVSHQIDFDAEVPSGPAWRLVLNALETRLEQVHEQQVIATHRLAAAPGCARFAEQLLVALGGSGAGAGGYHDASHRAWRWPDDQRRELIMRSLKQHIADTPATPLAGNETGAEWCGITDAKEARNLSAWLTMYAPTDARIWSFNCSDMLEFVSGYVLVRDGVFIAALPLAVSIGM